MPQLYDLLPWLRNMNLWELLVEQCSEALCPDAPPSVQEATLAAFFAGVTQPVAEMIEALYLSPLLRGRRTVWDILRRMARVASAKALPSDVVTGVCATIVRERSKALRRRIEPSAATWKITWRPTSVRLWWPRPAGVNGVKESFLVLVTEETGGTGEDGADGAETGEGRQTARVLAFRCTPDPPSSNETAETAVKLALYDALVFPPSAAGQFSVAEQFIWPSWQISPPTHLHVRSPIPKAIRQAARVWHTKVEEILQQDCTSCASSHSRQQRDSELEWEQPRQWQRIWTWIWACEKELAGRVLEPVHYLRILDRAFERAYGYAPFLAKQQVVRHLGWHMFPKDDPLRHCPGLQELLPSFPAVVAEDGSVEWEGWHYRDYDEDVLRYFPKAHVKVRPSPLAEAAILVYWHDAILCYAVAEELRHEDGSYRPYWFPYPRLGE